MNVKEQVIEMSKLPYQAPEAQRIILSRGMSILENFSAEADFEEFDDGGEL